MFVRLSPHIFFSADTTLADEESTSRLISELTNLSASSDGFVSFWRWICGLLQMDYSASADVFLSFWRCICHLLHIDLSDSSGGLLIFYIWVVQFLQMDILASADGFHSLCNKMFNFLILCFWCLFLC